jgi:HK97 family phage portal protein
LQALISRGIIRLLRTGSNLFNREAPALPTFPETDRLFFLSPHLLMAHLRQGGLTHPYKDHVWVYSCVNAIAQNLMGIPLLFFTGSRKDKKLVETGPLVQLFETPNPMMSGAQLIEATFIYLGLCGEAFYIAERKNPREVPKELWTFHPNRFKEVVDKDTGLIAGWTYEKGGKKVPFEAHEIIFFRYFNPYHEYRGLAPLQAAQAGIDQDFWASRYNAAFFKNNAQPGGILETSANLGDEEFKRLLAQWNDRHQGANKAHAIALLEGGVTYKQTGLSQKDMDFLEQRKFNREEIMAAFKVPKSELGIYEDLNFATAKTQDRVFWTKTLLPKMALFEFVIWHQLLSGLSGPEIWAEFDRTAVDALKEDLKEMLDAGQKVWQMGVPFNVVNETLNLGFPKVEGGDVGYLPFNLMPVGSQGLPDSSPAAAAPPSQPEKAAGPPPWPAASLHLPGPKVIMRRKMDPRASWQQYHHLWATLMGKFKGKMERFFSWQEELQIKLLEERLAKARLREYMAEDLLFNLPEANEILKKLAWPLYLTIGTESGKALFVELGADPANFVLADTAAMQVLKEKLIKVTRINDYTREKLREKLLEGLAQTETVNELQQRVKDLFGFSEARSLKIARTETGQAAAPARDAAMNELGVEKIQWLTAGDTEVRETHQFLEGMVVPRGMPFPNGCLYPCDPGGPAEQIINCRCVAVPVID